MRMALAIFVGLVFVAARPVQGQINGREPATSGHSAVVYVMGGVEDIGGALVKPQSTWIDGQPRPAVVGSVFAPIGRRWGVMLDVAVRSFDGYWQWDGQRPAGPTDNHARVTIVTAEPAFVGLVPVGAFRLYAGAGLGLQRQFERHSYRPLLGRENTKPVVADFFVNERASSTVPLLVASAGITTEIGRGLEIRAGFSCNRAWLDEPASYRWEFGIGRTFGGRR